MSTKFQTESSLQPFSLKSKTALITGASSGIGQSIAGALAAAGASVILCARREEPLRVYCESLKSKGMEAGYVVGDLSQKTEVAAIAQSAAECLGRSPDIIVHAAGINLRQAWQEITPESWDAQIELMLSSPFFLSQALVPAMIQKGWGRIIHIASLQSQRAFANSIPYGSAKGGVMQLTRAMAQAWSAHGITVNAIAPGFFPTELTQPVFNDAEKIEAIAQQTAVGRVGQLEDLHGAAVFFASDASSYITGQTLFVDGGFSAK